VPDRSRRAPLVAAGVIVAIVGLVAGVGLWIAAGQRLDDAVSGLARATVGCETVLDFDTGGEYIVFIETRGRIDDVRGDCGGDDVFEWGGSGDELPTARLTLTDPDGDDVTLRRRAGVRYGVGEYEGASVRSVTIDEGGDHTLAVESDDDDFAVAVGRDPNDGVGALRLGAVLAGITGSIGGIILVLLGLRRGRSPIVATWTAHGPPASGAGGAGWPSSPPGFPAPPPTTGTSAAVGPTSPPTVRLPTAPLPTAPLPSPPHAADVPAGRAPRSPSDPHTATRWGPPTSQDR
jgi:hypothetical protein